MAFKKPKILHFFYHIRRTFFANTQASGELSDRNIFKLSSILDTRFFFRFSQYVFIESVVSTDFSQIYVSMTADKNLQTAHDYIKHKRTKVYP